MSMVRSTLLCLPCLGGTPGSIWPFIDLCVIFTCSFEKIISFKMILAPNFLKHFSMKKTLHYEPIKSETRLENVKDKIVNVFSI